MVYGVIHVQQNIINTQITSAVSTLSPCIASICVTMSVKLCLVKLKKVLNKYI